jgi:hypothetical protein
MRSYKGAARGYRDLGNLPVPLQFDGDELPGLGEGIQRPVGCLGLVLGAEHTIGLGEELARWILGDTSAMIFERCGCVRRGLRPVRRRSPRPSMPSALKRWMRSRTVLG